MSFKPQEIQDSIGVLGDGMNGNLPPILLPKTQMSYALNVTVRGLYAKPRPPVQILELSSAAKTLIASAFALGPWQGACYYNPDVGDETLIAAIGGRLFQFHPLNTPVTVDEITILGDPNPAGQEQAWLWQSEKWVIWTDGVSTTIFFDGTSSRRSNYGIPVNHNTLTGGAAAVIVPPIGSIFPAPVDLVSVADIIVGNILTFANIGTFLVQDLPGGNTVTLQNINAQAGKSVAVGTVVTWVRTGLELPPGRMGVYGMGRNAMSLVDGKSYIISDIVGASSGSQPYNYRDSVLKIVENNYLAGGGFFSVPGSIGDIRAMIYAAILDTSLGQGPLMVFTHSNVFSCQTPVDRLTWQDVTNPLQTQALIGNGALGQNSTITANSDIIFRSIEGIRSETLARREFQTWGNVPISSEVSIVLLRDSTDLLRFGSALNWDNRLLMTASPVLLEGVGIYFRSFVVINYDPISSLRGKSESVYDGVWTGLNTLQLVTGEFRERPRAFSFTWNVNTSNLELYELLKNEDTSKDNGTSDIVMEIRSASLFNYPDTDPKHRELKQLMDGEIYVDSIRPGTTASFQAYYKPDQWPCFVPWFEWETCASTSGNPDVKPQFRPRMGLGEPSPIPCDETTNRPLRNAYSFQFRLIFTNCKFLGARFKAVTIPQDSFAPQTCLPQCP